MKRPIPLACSALCAALVLAACATPAPSNYPSLLPRAIEQRSDAVTVPEAPVAAADPALDARIAELAKTLAETDTAFTDAAAKTETAVMAAQGEAVGSDSWIYAQTLLAELDGYRAQSLSALDDFDQAAIARATDGQPAYPSLDAARDAAESQLGTETKRIADLSALLPQA